MDNILFEGRLVDISSLVIGGIDYQDFPDLCDIFVESGEYTTGEEMTDVELEQFQAQHSDLVYEMAYDFAMEWNER